MVAPHAGDLVDQRHRRVRILEHVGDRKIRRDVAGGQRGKRRRDESELRERGRPGDAHQRVVAQPRADNRNDRLDQGKPQRQHQRVMAELCDHFFFPVPSSQRPCFFNASTTSFGI